MFAQQHNTPLSLVLIPIYLFLLIVLASWAIQLELTSKSFTFELSDEIYYFRCGNLTDSPNFILVLFSFTVCL